MQTRRFFTLFLILAAVRWVSAAEELAAPTETPGPQSPLSTSAEESEDIGIIPSKADTLINETGPITPVTEMEDKSPYQQAQEELVRAHELFNSGNYEAASDTALIAYDDFTGMPRVPGVTRATLRTKAREAAKVYIDASIAYIKKSISKESNAYSLDEARGRLEDLRDVARNYPDLTKKLNKALNDL